MDPMICGKRSPKDTTRFCEFRTECSTHARPLLICSYVLTVQKCQVREHECFFTGKDYEQAYKEMFPEIPTVSTIVRTEPLHRRLSNYVKLKNEWTEAHIELTTPFRNVAHRILRRIKLAEEHSGETTRWSNGQIENLDDLNDRRGRVRVQFTALGTQEFWDIPVAWAVLYEENRIETLDDLIFKQIMAPLEHGDFPAVIPHPKQVPDSM